MGATATANVSTTPVLQEVIAEYLALTRNLRPVKVEVVRKGREKSLRVKRLKVDPAEFLKTATDTIFYHHEDHDDTDLLKIEVHGHGQRTFVVKRCHAQKICTQDPKRALQTFRDNLPVV